LHLLATSWVEHPCLFLAEHNTCVDYVGGGGYEPRTVFPLAAGAPPTVGAGPSVFFSFKHSHSYKLCVLVIFVESPVLCWNPLPDS